MTARQLRALYNRLAYGADETDHLTDLLAQHKRQVYEDTLLELAHQHGYTVDDGFELGWDVIKAIDRDASQAAAQIVGTYNRDLREQLDRMRLATPEQAEQAVAAWSAQRAQDRADLIATTEAYPAHADAILSFYEAAGVEPTYDFGGHGDAAPACDVCQAIEAGNPHPHEDVISIGSPHPNCAQTWRARVDDAALPDELDLGQHPAGILGQQPLTIRAGGTQAAVDHVDTLPGAPPE